MNLACVSILPLILLTACATGPTPLPPATPIPASTLPPTLSPSPTLPPTPTLVPAPTAAPAATRTRTIRQLTSGRCCPQAFWSPDGSQVWFIDHPSETQPAGLWGINTDGGEPQFITARPGFYSRDGSLIAYPENGRAYIEQVADGVRWEAPTGGRSFTFSPDVTRIAWQINFSTFNFDRRTVEVWMANVDGSNARSVAQLTGGGLLGWFPDSARLLVTNRESPGADITLAVLSLAEGSLTPLVQSPTLRGGLISPEGGWIAYQITFSGDAANDGLWVIRSDGRDARRLDIFGSYRWRAEGQLVVVPLESISGAQSHRLIQLDAATGMAAPLTDPALTPFRIANGDWAVSLDGSQIVFLSADDRNLWLIALP